MADNERNTLKWASIPLMIPYLLKGYETPREKLRAAIFSQPMQATQKYDGTNVGKDENGIMYGRNLLISDSAGNYQKTSLAGVKALNVKTLKTTLCKQIDLQEDKIDCFNLYGELMCNKGLYNYATDKLAETHQIFGAMIRPANAGVVQEIADKLGAGKFACVIRSDKDDEEEEPSSADAPASCIMLFLNAALKTLVTEAGYPTVPIAGYYDCFYDLVQANYDWMENGRGEGLVIITPALGSNCVVSKWKNGTEASSNNMTHLEDILKAIDEDKDKTIFGEDTEKAKDLFNKMIVVAKSKKINGALPGAPKPKAAPAKKGPVVFSEEKTAEYAEAIKSALTKFDHQDTFFAKGMKGVDEYAALIAKECLSDITIEAGDADGLKDHNAYITGIVKEMFVAFKRAGAKK